MSDLSIFKFCVEDDGMSTVVGPLLDLKSLFTLYVCNTKLNKNYRPFIALLLQKENAASRMGRVCLRERRRRQKLNPSAPKLWIFMNNKEHFQNLNPSSYFRSVPSSPVVKDLIHRTTHVTLISRYRRMKSIVVVTVWNGLHLVRHARFIKIEPGR
jgi:hypothetical protein